MNEKVTMAELMQDMQAGNAQAAEALFQRYSDRLTRVAEQHMNRKVAQREDGADVVQSVFRTFFRRNDNGQFRIDSSAQIWRLLVEITVLKARERGRFHTAARRNVAVETNGQDQSWLVAAAGREPGPEEATILEDTVDALLAGLPPQYGEILQLRLQGQTVVDVAAQLSVSRQTVYRMLALLQHRLIAHYPDSQGRLDPECA
ncbi:MAG TPA: sigma-70 family RNA polymerase sigma factor [Gemmataceae bacterium]|nr:sigma-70 family RNA polymerase sigma factor [Gemmataceae bacterium]